jgi:hypothetical protein
MLAWIRATLASGYICFVQVAVTDDDLVLRLQKCSGKLIVLEAMDVHMAV